MPRKKLIAFEDLKNYLDLPISVVAKRFGVCTTLLKKICRKHGISRWPHRKLKCIEKMIMSLEGARNESLTPDELMRIDAELEDLRRQRELILENPNYDVKISSHMKRRFGHVRMSLGEDSPGDMDSVDSPLPDDESASVSEASPALAFRMAQLSSSAPVAPGMPWSVPVPVPTVYSVDGSAPSGVFMDGGHLFPDMSFHDSMASSFSSRCWMPEDELRQECTVPDDEEEEGTEDADQVTMDESVFPDGTAAVAPSSSTTVVIEGAGLGATEQSEPYYDHPPLDPVLLHYPTPPMPVGVPSASASTVVHHPAGGKSVMVFHTAVAEMDAALALGDFEGLTTSS